MATKAERANRTDRRATAGSSLPETPEADFPALGRLAESQPIADTLDGKESRSTGTETALIGGLPRQPVPKARQLVISFDVRTADNRVYLQSPHLQSLEKALLDIGLVKPGDVSLKFVPLTDCNFEAACRAPAEPQRVPIEVELFHGADPRRLMMRARVGLNWHDGVTCVYVALNILEYLETGSIAQTSRLAKPNPPPSDHPIKCYLRMLKLASYNVGCSAPDFLQWLGSKVVGSRFEPVSGCFRAFLQDLEGEEPSYRRFQVPETMSFRDYVQQICAGLRSFGFKGFIYSINYHPKVAMSVTSHEDTLLRKELRTSNMFLPPFPINPGNMFSMLFASHVLFNNYGRHKPNITGEVVDIDWYSPGMSSNVTMALTLTVGTRTWLVFRARKRCQELFASRCGWLSSC